ncbi:YgfZ/GcvT domain-containing protein, partial [Collimonas sp.]|uniref:CAF17-like 4Fe-4S cluster assembly/insertion protein YgfZ n=1 Tax=Collimonas sp. TaxID=1963772 RepID=UPI002C07E67C|nr:folate-binding protein [Collimonas sp.]
QVTLATQEQFVPQMINFEVVGGVNFKKGCYPGQEIVARSQYLGKLKRRAVLASVAATGITAATEVFSSNDPEQPCGMIVNAEADSAHSSLCLLEIKLAALENGTVHLGSATGAQLQFHALPYSIIDVTDTELSA